LSKVTSVPEERTYTEEEIAEILREAAGGQASEGNTRSEVLAAASEAGLDVQRVEAVMDRPRPATAMTKGKTVVRLDFPVPADQIPLALAEMPHTAPLRAKHNGAHFSTVFEKGMAFVSVEVFSDSKSTTVSVSRSRWGSVVAMMFLTAFVCGISYIISRGPSPTDPWAGSGFGVLALVLEMGILLTGFIPSAKSDRELAERIASRYADFAPPTTD
jgi:hypothetical protein